MTGQDIINAANARFFNGPNGKPTWVYLYGGNGSTVLTQNGITGPGIDCSHFVYQALLYSGRNVSYIDTPGFRSIVNGNASTDYTKVSVGQPGDIILFTGTTIMLV